MAALPKAGGEPGGVFVPAKVPVPANDNSAERYPGIVSSADFIRGFVPPDYHIDGIAQRGFLYSMTAASGTGKTAILLLIAAMTALGQPLADREVAKGRVVYFAGENPDDVRMRWIGMANEMGFDLTAIDVHFIPGTFSIPQMMERVRADVTKLGGVQLVVVDTSAAYFQGAEENSNTELGRHARELRSLTTLSGRPCVMVACHPTKSAAQDNLLPRGGGAFIAEVDGNLVAMKTPDGTVRLHWQGKHRGPDFAAIDFDLAAVTSPILVDSRGRQIPTVMAKTIASSEVRQRALMARKDEDVILLEIDRDGNQSLSDMADGSGWKAKDGGSDKSRARRAVDKLKASKFVLFDSRKYRLTSAGKEAAVDARKERFEREATGRTVASMVQKSRA